MNTTRTNDDATGDVARVFVKGVGMSRNAGSQDNASNDDATMTAQEVADALGVDAKTFRGWWRRRAGGTLASKGHGRNARYAFRASDLDAIRKAFGDGNAKRVLVAFNDDANDDA